MKIKKNGVEYDLNLKTPKLNIDYNPVNNSIHDFYQHYIDLYKKEKIKNEKRLRVDKLNEINKNK